MARVCLNMIVKDEAAIIERSLAAVAPHVDCYFVCDTGSSDATVALVRAVMDRHGVPGAVVTAEFRDFAQARNAALDAARASDLDFDYLLLCDADMELRVRRPDYRRRLHARAYRVAQRTGGLEWTNIRLVRRDVPARYRGATHEYLDVGGDPVDTLDDLAFVDHAEGTSRSHKLERDEALLVAALARDPEDARAAFYLAGTRYDLGRWEEAIDGYERRIALGGWLEEVYYSSYRIGLCLGRLGREPEMVVRLLATFDAFPHRAEPLHALALHYQRQERHLLAYHMAEIASRIPVPDGGLFVERDVHEWRLTDIMAVSLHWLGRPVEAVRLNRGILDVVPAEERERIRENLAHSQAAAAGRTLRPVR